MSPEEEQEFQHKVLKAATDDLLTVSMERSHEFIRGVAWAVDRIHENAGMESMGITDWLHRILDSHGDNDVETTVVVENTGEAVSDGSSDAITGYSGPAPRRGQKITVKNTGNAVATGGGTASSGIVYTDKKEKS